jgi:hypothetical protein
VDRSRSGRRPGGSRRKGMRALLATVIAGAALVMVTSAVAGAAPSMMHSNISVTHFPSPLQAFCLPAQAALTNSVRSDEASFTVRIEVAAPLCEPIEAVAAIYRMPGSGVAWPQELMEFSRFTIARAGAIEVRFTKTCVPAQFDVLTGAVPQTISPWGEAHGPLLFPFDTDTALQHWGADCDGAPVTTVPPTTGSPTTGSPTTGSPTTAAPLPPAPTTPPTGGTPPPAAEGPTDVAGVTTTVAEVLAAAQQNPPRPGVPPFVEGTNSGPAAPLAFSGVSSLTAAFAGLALLFSGLSLLALMRACRPRPVA